MVVERRSFPRETGIATTCSGQEMLDLLLQPFEARVALAQRLILAGEEPRMAPHHTVIRSVICT